MLHPMSSAATLVRTARTDADLSCGALARRVGVPTSTISRIERGEMDPTVTMLERVLAAAGQQLRVSATRAGQGPTLAKLASAYVPDGSGTKIDWTRLRGFLDWLARHPEQVEAAIEVPPARTGTVLDALLAGIAEKVADDHGVVTPRWTRAVPAATPPWSPPGTPRMIAKAARATPDQLRRRGVVLAESDLWRPNA